MNNSDMKFVEQDDNPTCGICCYAMLTDLTLSQALTKLKKHMNPGGILTKDLIKGIQEAGYTVTNKRLRWVGNKTWNELSDLCLVKVRPDDCPQHHWHWVLWNNGAIYDSILGIQLPEIYPYPAISFVELK